MPSKVEYVPMFWGPSKWDKWSARLDEMNQAAPKYLMAFNEPDVESQANMDPYYAAQLYMEQINPWASKGAKLGSPAIAWSLDWMSTFLSEISNKGGTVDFICLHWFVFRVLICASSVAQC
jgi:Glycosyl hydrolase catalytic core